MKLINNMFLYHGSYCAVTHPDLSFCSEGRDFGRGFYLTSDKQQAIQFIRNSIRKHRITETKGFVSIYQLVNLDNLNIYSFHKADAEWLTVVSAYRGFGNHEILKQYHDYDVMAGKIANDKTNQTIQAYIGGIFGKVGSSRAMRFAISLLEPDNLVDQVCFRTERAIQALHYIKSEEYTV